ncbi:alpha/beta hydrolase [Magnetofaba australis]|uniref:Uncharacterized protein n=1 Tax=Magnetofaba australis IT-1 TaxID=1434232 RepID=A0A1Y2K8V3_9PROT|nr:alpha/beta hydrolase [Magnetofaba australis]OSM06927.1 hypothetical protein MAIT1_00188 [Magnetofaba australis IT-1]
MVIVVSNRNVEREGNDGWFGEELGESNGHNLRVGVINGDADSWSMQLLPDSSDPASSPSRSLFEGSQTAIQNAQVKLAGGESLTAGERALFRWVFFAHGFNTSFEESVKTCLKMAKRYTVNVILFSWPSNPGPQFLLAKYAEYKKAALNARLSSLAFDRALTTLGLYWRTLRQAGCEADISMMTYSQGNYLLEQYIRSNHHDADETNIFKNIVLCSADVDYDRHGDWVPLLTPRGQVYVTINEYDSVLNISDKVNPKRLGQMSRCAGQSEAAIYVDFTDTPKVGATHRMYETAAKKHTGVKAFFQAALTGKPAHRVKGLQRNAGQCVWQPEDRDQWLLEDDERG